MPLTRDATGTWDIDVPVTAPAGVVVTSDLVYVQFIQSGKPTDAGWLAATWSTNSQGQTVARLTVGPGQTFTPTVGDWYEWIKIVDNPETVIWCAGTVTFT